MNLKQAVVGILAAGAVIGTAMILPSLSQAQDAKVKAAMELLQSKAEKLGPAKLEGTDKVGDKDVPAIYFGSAKIDNNFDLVDAVVKEAGGTATIFVKSGDEYVRVSTNVPKADGPGGRAIGTTLAHNPAYDAISKDQAFYGDVDILGKPYTTGYAPIHNASKAVIGIYYVGYAK
ncbi:MAG: Cache 3/Cache 2 fusion domain-containing protein [Xanthobacteraceae bacterium]